MLYLYTYILYGFIHICIHEHKYTHRHTGFPRSALLNSGLSSNGLLELVGISSTFTISNQCYLNWLVLIQNNNNFHNLYPICYLNWLVLIQNNNNFHNLYPICYLNWLVLIQNNNKADYLRLNAMDFKSL